MATINSYAIVETGGKQYRAEKGASIVVERLPEEEGAKVSLRPVMFRDDKKVVLDAKELEKVKVEAVVAGHERAPKVRVFKYKAKKGYRRRAGHRQGLTRLEVTDVRLLTRKPAQKKAAGGRQQTAEATPKKPRTKKPAAKARPAAGKASPKKPATKKGTTARKPAASKRRPRATSN
jgi:large subunit ribosomal protein L21